MSSSLSMAGGWWRGFDSTKKVVRVLLEGMGCWSDWCLRAKAFGVESLYNSSAHEKSHVLDKKNLSPLHFDREP
jgi:hypothetical protein